MNTQTTNAIAMKIKQAVLNAQTYLEEIAHSKHIANSFNKLYSSSGHKNMPAEISNYTALSAQCHTDNLAILAELPA